MTEYTNYSVRGTDRSLFVELILNIDLCGPKNIHCHDVMATQTHTILFVSLSRVMGKLGF